MASFLKDISLTRWVKKKNQLPEKKVLTNCIIVTVVVCVNTNFITFSRIIAAAAAKAEKILFK